MNGIETENKFAKRHDLMYLGRLLGTCTGWDGEGMEWMVFYDFIPAPGIALVACDLCIDSEAGFFSSVDDNGEVIWRKDVLSVLATVERTSVELTS